MNKVDYWSDNFGLIDILEHVARMKRSVIRGSLPSNLPISQAS